MKHIAAKLVLSGLAILMAITPVPFEKWAWQRIAFGILGLAGMASTKSKIDQEMEEQHLVDVQAFEEKLYERELAQVQRQLALEAARQQEAIRFGLQTKMATADYQGAFVTLMEEKHPYYLDALQAQQQAALEAQSRSFGYSAGAQDNGRAIEAIQENGSLFGSVEPQDKGQRLLQRLRKSNISILIVGSTGAGKSHTLSAYLERLYQDSPDADVWVISRKNDSFCGLREANRVVRFNSLDPTEALDKLREFHTIFQKRTEVLEEDRHSLSTVRLILEDWSSICLILKTNKAIWNEVKIILSDIVTVGRDLNICLVILAQSAILESLGLVGDSNLRSCLAIVAQGLESINSKGEEQGDYNLIQLILKNPYIIPSDEDRESLSTELVDLIPESRRTRQPVFLCTSGKPFVGFLPKITKANVPIVSHEEVTTNNSTSHPKQEVNPSPIASIESQKKQLDATFNKEYNPLDHLLQEASQEQLDELIKNWREMADTSQSGVSDTSIPKEVSDTYQTPEPLPGNDSIRIWDSTDFAKYLPKCEELAMFQELDTHYKNVSHSPSRIIKEAWKLTRGDSYRLLGVPCFVYLVTKYGTEEQKKSPKFARLIANFLESVDDENLNE